LKFRIAKFNGEDEQLENIEIWFLIYHRKLKHNFHSLWIENQCDEYFESWKDHYPNSLNLTKGEIYNVEFSIYNSILIFKGIFTSENDAITIEKLLKEEPNCIETKLKTKHEEIFENINKEFNHYYNEKMVVSKDNSDIYGYCCPYLAKIIQNAVDMIDNLMIQKIEENKICKPNFKLKKKNINDSFVDPWGFYHKNKLYSFSIKGKSYSERKVCQPSIEALYTLAKKLFLKSFSWKIKDADLNQMLAIYQLFNKWQEYIGDRKEIRLEKDGIKLVCSQNKEHPIVFIDEQLMEIEKESVDDKELNNIVDKLLDEEEFNEIANDASIKKKYKKVIRMWEVSVKNWLPDEKPNQDTSKIGHF
jgi:hypothetical protein